MSNYTLDHHPPRTTAIIAPPARPRTTRYRLLLPLPPPPLTTRPRARHGNAITARSRLALHLPHILECARPGPADAGAPPVGLYLHVRRHRQHHPRPSAQRDCRFWHMAAAQHGRERGQRLWWVGWWCMAQGSGVHRGRHDGEAEKSHKAARMSTGAGSQVRLGLASHFCSARGRRVLMMAFWCSCGRACPLRTARRSARQRRIRARTLHRRRRRVRRCHCHCRPRPRRHSYSCNNNNSNSN